MTTINFVEILVYLAIIVALTPLMGGYMKRVFSGERTFLDPVLRPVERGIYRSAASMPRRTRAGWTGR